VSEGEHILLDCGLYDPKRSEDVLRNLANVYAEGAYHFGQYSLTTCGADVAYQNISVTVEEDDDGPEVQVIKVFIAFQKKQS
jgi:hypothetical protein